MCFGSSGEINQISPCSHWQPAQARSQTDTLPGWPRCRLLVAYNSSQPTDLGCFILQAFSSVALSVRSLPTPCLPFFIKLSLIPLCLCSTKLEETIWWIQVVSEETDSSIYKPLFLLETKVKTGYKNCSLLLNNVCVKHTKHSRITGEALPACSSPVV